MKRQIICFANSKKNNAYCFAGKDMETSEWVRPIQSFDATEMTLENQCLNKVSCEKDRCSGGNDCNYEIAKKLDIISLETEEPLPISHQRENHIINGQPWEKVGTLPNEYLEYYTDKHTGALWINEPGEHSEGCINNRFSSELASDIDYSLIFIKVEDLELKMSRNVYEPGEFKYRGSFKHENVEYCFDVTDLEYIRLLEEYRRDNNDGCSVIFSSSKKIFLTLSVGLPYKNKIYKFISGIIIAKIV